MRLRGSLSAGSPTEKRAEICEKMRRAVKHRKPAYSLDAHRAAEMLGVSFERVEIMAKDGALGHCYRRHALFVSSKDVAALLAERERQRSRCPLRAAMKGREKR